MTNYRIEHGFGKTIFMVLGIIFVIAGTAIGGLPLVIYGSAIYISSYFVDIKIISEER